MSLNESATDDVRDAAGPATIPGNENVRPVCGRISKRPPGRRTKALYTQAPMGWRLRQKVRSRTTRRSMYGGRRRGPRFVTGFTSGDADMVEVRDTRVGVIS